MTEQKDNMAFIGSIQNIGKPYADLYIDHDKNQLYLFVRQSLPLENKERYAAIPVSADQIMEYMDSSKTLSEVFSLHPYRYAFIKDRKVNLEDGIHTSSKSTFIYNKPFDPHFCSNRIKLKTALRRMMANTEIQ